MNAKQLIAAVAVFAAASSAFADPTGDFTDFVNLPSSKTRAEVTAELRQARNEGSYTIAGGQEFVTTTTQTAGIATSRANTAVAATPAKTRAEVVAELKQAQANGSYIVGGEEYASPVAVARNGRNRDAVRNEALATGRGNKAGTQESGS